MTYYIYLNYRDWKVGVIGAIGGVIGAIRGDMGPNCCNSYNYGPEFRSIGLVQTPIRLDSVDK